MFYIDPHLLIAADKMQHLVEASREDRLPSPPNSHTPGPHCPAMREAGLSRCCSPLVRHRYPCRHSRGSWAVAAAVDVSQVSCHALLCCCTSRYERAKMRPSPSDPWTCAPWPCVGRKQAKYFATADFWLGTVFPQKINSCLKSKRLKG